MFVDFFKNKAKEKALLVRFTKEAKELQKSSALKNVTLEQCKRDIARRYGYPSWSHLEDNIACKKPSTSDKNRLLSTNEPTKDSEITYLGYDVLLSNFRWLRSSEFQHTLILGEDRYDNYDFHLALQAIQQQRNVIFINGTGDVETLNKLLSVAKDVGRENEIAIYSLHNEEGFLEQARTLSSRLTDSKVFSDAMLGLIMFPEGYDPSFQKWYNFAQNMLELMAPMYIYNKQSKDIRNKNINYSFKEFYDFLDVKNLRFAFNFLDNYPVDLQQNVVRYLSQIPGFKEENMDKVWETHAWITQMVKRVIGSIEQDSIDLFDADGDSFENLFSPKEGQTRFIKILHLNDEDDSLKNLASYCFFAGAQKFIDSINPEDELSKKSVMVFLRETPYDVNQNFYSEARNSGLSFFFSYKNEDSVNKYVLSPESLLHNVNISVVSLPQSDFYPDVADFPKQPHEKSLLLKKDGITLQLFLPN